MDGVDKDVSLSLSLPLSALEGFRKRFCGAVSNHRGSYKLGFPGPKDLQLSVELRGNLGLLAMTQKPPSTPGLASLQILQKANSVGWG